MDISTRITKLWHWCQQAYLRQGRRLRLPARTDPTKTYQWRYLQALDRKLRQLDLDDATSQRFIEIAAAYAREKRLTDKGLAIFFQNNILDICATRLAAEAKQADGDVAVLRDTHQWLTSKKGAKPLREVLLSRPHLGGYTNLVGWAQSGRLSPAYLAISKPCGSAIARLAQQAPAERDLLPKQVDLVVLRMKLLHNAEFVERANAILGEECIKP